MHTGQMREKKEQTFGLNWQGDSQIGNVSEVLHMHRLINCVNLWKIYVPFLLHSHNTDFRFQSQNSVGTIG